MEHEMRRKDRQMSTEETLELIERGEYGVFATTGEEGYPYAVPVNYCYVDGKIYFHGTIEKGYKYYNICHSDKVCFTIVGNTEVLPSEFATNYESAIIIGKAKIAEDETVRQAVFKKLIEKYSSDFMKSGMEYIDKMAGVTIIYEITPEKITGKRRK